jgi:hypothetical protein
VLTVIHVSVENDPLIWVPAWLTLALLVTAAIVAGLQVREARRLRVIQVRPYVDVDFDVSRPPMIYLVIRNTGNGRATDVHVTFDPPLTSSLDREGDDRVASFVGHSWPALVPGKRVETLFDSAIARLADNSPLPLRYTVSVTYSAPDFPKEKFRDQYELDIGAYRNMHYTRERGIEDLAKALDGLKRVFDKWDHNGALEVVTTDRKQADEELKQLYEERRRFFAERTAESQATPEGSASGGPSSHEDEAPSDSPAHEPRMGHIEDDS